VSPCNPCVPVLKSRRRPEGAERRDGSRFASVRAIRGATRLSRLLRCLGPRVILLCPIAAVTRPEASEHCPALGRRHFSNSPAKTHGTPDKRQWEWVQRRLRPDTRGRPAEPTHRCQTASNHLRGRRPNNAERHQGFAYTRSKRYPDSSRRDHIPPSTSPIPREDAGGILYEVACSQDSASTHWLAKCRAKRLTKQATRMPDHPCVPNIAWSEPRAGIIHHHPRHPQNDDTSRGLIWRGDDAMR